MKESYIESKVCTYAKSKQYIVYKLDSRYASGWPDRLFINKYGFIFFIEFKSAIGKLRPIQSYVIEKLKFNKCIVFVINDIDKGKSVIDYYEDYTVLTANKGHLELC